MSTLWTATDIINACSGRGKATEPVSGISIDSRTLNKGDAFFAIKGDVFDGHRFVDAAFLNGAALAVVSDPSMVGDKLVYVHDVLHALEEVGRAARARLTGRAIAVTGSVGKTSTKEALRAAFGACGDVHASVASFNNHWGVPITLARTPSDVNYAIYEIGMNHAGEISDLVQMVRPHVGIITTVGSVHLEFFEDEAGIARAKGELFDGIVAGGHAVLNRDNVHYDLLCDMARTKDLNIVSFGEAPSSDVRLVSFKADGIGALVEAEVFGRAISFPLSQSARHVAQNMMAVLAAVHLCDADIEKAAQALSGVGATVGRGARHDIKIADGGTALVLDESYNANPVSMRAALQNLSDMPCKGRRIAVLGDMLELGENSGSLHKSLSEILVSLEIDTVYLCGRFMKQLWDVLPASMHGAYASSSDQLLAHVVADVSSDDCVMIKGSLGSRMQPIVGALLKRE